MFEINLAGFYVLLLKYLYCKCTTQNKSSFIEDEKLITTAMQPPALTSNVSLGAKLFDL